MISTATGAWLREQRQARGWPVPEMARQLRDAARDNGDSTLPDGEAICRNIRRWESGRGGASERYRLHYAKAFGVDPGQFGAGRPQPAAAAPAAAPDGYRCDETVTRIEQLAIRLCAATAECAEAAAALARVLAGRPAEAGLRAETDRSRRHPAGLEGGQDMYCAGNGTDPSPDSDQAAVPGDGPA
jgi:hypothetical protein